MLSDRAIVVRRISRDANGNVVRTVDEVIPLQHIAAAAVAFCAASALFGFFSAMGRAAFEALACAAGGC